MVVKAQIFDYSSIYTVLTNNICHIQEFREDQEDFWKLTREKIRESSQYDQIHGHDQ